MKGSFSLKVYLFNLKETDRVALSVARETQEPEVPGSIPGPATYFRFSFRFKKQQQPLRKPVCTAQIS